ncbi:MAG: thioredoxin-disulfide reductase [Bacteroidetes bacterium]|nr:MAG: thioredoxin-disulfide reductase [Bacteroidota bacterium]
MESNHYDVIIIGGGPAGLTSGIYLSRAKTKTLILDQGTIGGQVVLTHEIANYPGIESISGYQLAKTMRKQAKKFGCDIRSNIKISSLELKGEIKKIVVNDKDKYTAPVVILSTGGKSRPLNVPGEIEFAGKGISYCATCDGDFFQDKEIIVVGGGNSALEEAVSLTQYASKVTIVHQFDHFQAYPHAIDEVKNNPKIDFIMESEITEFYGNESLQRVKIEHQGTHETNEMKIDGVFIFIGYIPQTKFIDDQVKLNERQEIIVDKDFQTNIEGVFAAGDSIEKKYRQITTATADGTIAALNAIEYINSKK